MEAPQIVSWSDILRAGLALLITGHRRRGKTGLGHYLLELCHKKNMRCYIVGVPHEKEIFLPFWITNIPFSLDLPEDAVIFIDEAALEFYAREHQKDSNKLISKVLGAAGQKGQIIIFATHHTRKLDVNIILDMDVWALKRPSKMHVRLERKEVKPILKDVLAIYDLYIDKTDKSATVIVDEERDNYLIAYNELPEHWNIELSEIFRGVSLEDEVDEEVDIEEYGESQAGLPTSCDDAITIHYMRYMKPSILALIAKEFGYDLNHMVTVDWDSALLERSYIFNISKQKDGLYYMSGRVKPSAFFEQLKLFSENVIIDIKPEYEAVLA